MEAINLNIIPGKTWPVAHASQFDVGRTFRANLFEGSAVYTLDGTETLSVIVKKPDGNQVTAAITNTSDNYVEVVTTEQMTACEGSNLAEIRIEKGDDVIGTLNFILECEKSPDTGIESDSAIHNLEQQVTEIVSEQYDSANVIFDNAPTPGHGVPYVVTSEGVPDEITDLTDVTITTPVSGEALVWDGSKWTNGAPSLDLDDLGDVVITSPTAGEILEYDGAEWVNVPNPASTDNFGAPYDESTTYNVPSLVIENNLLFKLNEGEVDVTGPFDPTKWTQTSLAELSGADIPIGTSSDTSTIAGAIGDLSQLTTTDKSSLVGAVNTLAPTAYSLATRSGALSSGSLGYVKIGKVVIANLNYTTNTSNVSTHNTVLYSDLPPAISNAYLNFVDEAGNVTRVRVGTDGKMYLHYSTIVANKEINGSFVYLSA